MRSGWFVLPSLVACGMVVGPACQALCGESKGCQDTVLFSRMPGYHLSSCKESEFDQEKMNTGAGEITVEGRKSVLYYELSSGAAVASSTQILRNYENAIKAAGGAVTWDSRFYAHFKLERAGIKTWVAVAALNPYNYYLTIVEEAGMRQVVKADADAWLKELVATGHAAVYGIYFDTGLAVVKPESRPTLAEMAKLLKAHPSLNVFIVGHTDSTGTYDFNVRLSQDRAAAVVKVLVSQYGIAASRLQAGGVGPLAPAASNRGEAGRAKNRRVELVEK